jgi:aryl-alcohol dehydrogenase-like predicted oxidoreductase
VRFRVPPKGAIPFSGSGRFSRQAGGQIAFSAAQGPLKSICALNGIAQARGQTLARRVIAWVLHDGGITDALIGASRPEPGGDGCGVISKLDFAGAERAQINQAAGRADMKSRTKAAKPDRHRPKPTPDRPRMA